jgi:hypothetical protein
MEPELFKNQAEALRWLRAQGCEVARGKFYADAKVGRYLVRPDKAVSRASVAEYLVRHLREQPAPVLDLVDYSQERQALEVKKLKLEVEKREIDNRHADRAWIRRDQAWANVAGLVVALDDALRHHLYEGQGLLVHAAGGDHSRGPQVYEAAVELIAAAFNELAGARIEGMFADAGAEDEDEGA